MVADVRTERMKMRAQFDRVITLLETGRDPGFQARPSKLSTG